MNGDAEQRLAAAEAATAMPEHVVEVMDADAVKEEALKALPEMVDAYNAQLIESLASESPEVRFRHSSTFTDQEDKIIAAGIVSGVALYKVAQSIHCSYQTMKEHIEKTPALLDLLKEEILREQQDLEEAIRDCVKARVPAVLMWKAERILPEKYGAERRPEEEDDTRIVIGAIPEDEIKEGDKILSEAANLDPSKELGAVAEALLGDGGGSRDDALAGEMERELVRAGGEVADVPLKDTLPAPAVKPPKGDPNFMPYRQGAEDADFRNDEPGGGGGTAAWDMQGDDYGGDDLW